MNRYPGSKEAGQGSESVMAQRWSTEDWGARHEQGDLEFRVAHKTYH